LNFNNKATIHIPEGVGALRYKLHSIGVLTECVGN
jgi:hypothetical protein